MDHSPDLAPPHERRESERMATTLRGKVFPGAVDCSIRDMSRRGARLAFEDGPYVGTPAVVVIWTTGCAFEVTQRWAAGDEIGVLFHHRRDLRGKAPPHMAEIKALWLARRQQLNRTKIRRCDAIVGHRPPPRSVRLS